MDTNNGPRWLCAACRHLQQPINFSSPSCAAFPNGIPWEIQIGQVRHTQPYPGDNGVRFEPIEGDE